MRVPQEVDEPVQLEDSNIVVEVAGRVLGVDLDGEHVQLQVRIELGVVVHVPLSQSHAELLGSSTKSSMKTRDVIPFRFSKIWFKL